MEKTNVLNQGTGKKGAVLVEKILWRKKVNQLEAENF
jgi:hypothetical protein